MEITLTVTEITDLVPSEDTTWSGTIRIAAKTGLGEMEFTVPFEGVPTLEAGMKAAMTVLASFGQALGNMASEYAS
jgi:hypothetical protein